MVAEVTINSVALVPHFVAHDGAFSVCLDLPALVRHPKVRVLPLAGFPRVQIPAVSTHG